MSRLLVVAAWLALFTALVSYHPPPRHVPDWYHEICAQVRC